jgi:thiamine-monophosphate kinase
LTPEFNLIARYFTRPAKRAVLGIGDDCALIKVATGCELAISTDTLVEGIHFFADANAEKLGHKSLAVNLSDLAAMGAMPRYVTLALTLPSIDDAWLAAFSCGFFSLADEFDVELIGGDTTRGPLSITLTVMGEIEAGRALRRDGAAAGDDIWVSGTLGGAALALMHMQQKIQLQPPIFSRAEDRLHRPQPRIALGQILLGVASAAIDISDGLVADLNHICERSKLSAIIERHNLPLASALMSVSADLRDECALSGGDDYELCFTAPVAARAAIEIAGAKCGVAVTRVGSMKTIDPNQLVKVIDESGQDVSPQKSGYDHFAATPVSKHHTIT